MDSLLLWEEEGPVVVWGVPVGGSRRRTMVVVAAAAETAWIGPSVAVGGAEKYLLLLACRTYTTWYHSNMECNLAPKHVIPNRFLNFVKGISSRTPGPSNPEEVRNVVEPEYI